MTLYKRLVRYTMMAYIGAILVFCLFYGLGLFIADHVRSNRGPLKPANFKRRWSD